MKNGKAIKIAGLLVLGLAFDSSLRKHSLPAASMPPLAQVAL
jgi:hypothetical protein